MNPTPLPEVDTVTRIIETQPEHRPRGAVTGTIHFVPLQRLPAGLAFPAELVERIWFEPDRRRLAHRGFMSKSTFDRLDALHHDSSYQQALQDLFRFCVYESPVQTKRWRSSRIVLLVTGSAALVGSMIFALVQ